MPSVKSTKKVSADLAEAPSTKDYGSSDGGTTWVPFAVDSDGHVQIDLLTTESLDDYKISDVDADASPNYYGFLRKDGAWYILKETVSAGADTYRYVKGASGYNWSNRASETYVTFDSAF